MDEQESLITKAPTQLSVVCFSLCNSSFGDALQIGVVVNDDGDVSPIILSPTIRRRMASWQVQWRRHLRAPSAIALWLKHQRLNHWPIELQNLAGEIWTTPSPAVHHRLVALEKAAKARLAIEFESTVQGDLYEKLDQYHRERNQLLIELDALVERRHFGYYVKALEIVESSLNVVVDNRTFVNHLVRDSWSESVDEPYRALLQAGIDDFITLLQFHSKRLRRPLLRWQTGEVVETAPENFAGQVRAEAIHKEIEGIGFWNLPAQHGFDDDARRRRRQELIGLRRPHQQGVVMAQLEGQRRSKSHPKELKPWWPIHKSKPVIPLE